MKPASLFAAAMVLIAGSGAVVAGALGSSDYSRAPITRADLDHTSVRNIYDAISELRAGWLTTASADAAPAPTVFIEMPCADTTCLQWIGSDQVEVVHFVDSSSHSQFWPRQHPGGTIVVTLQAQSTDPHREAVDR